MQANKFKIPRLGFINKLDRQGASVQLTVDSIKRRLKVDPVLVNVPNEDSLSSKNNCAIIDLVNMLYYKYLDDMGKKVNIEEINSKH